MSYHLETRSKTSFKRKLIKLIEMGNNLMKYIVYCTINKVNGKFYIGVHQTETPYIFDNYLGGGSWTNIPSSYNKGETILHRAILKYGIKQFRRITLKVFETEKEALDFKAFLVDERMVNNPNNYNMVVGGGKPPILNKQVNQFDIKGNFIKTWDSETEIRKFYDCSVSMNDIIKNKRTFAGSLWSFDKEINSDDFIFESNHGYISQYDKSGNFIAMFKTATEASQKLDLDRQSITNAVFKKKLYSGCYFLKADVDIAEVISKKFKKSVGKQIIYRYLITGEFDREYETTSKAVNDTPGAYTSSLKNAVVNGYLCGGYRWSYKKSDNYFNIENPKETNKITKIAQYSKDGSLIKVFNSIKECKKEFPYCLRVCRGDLKSTKGYVFKYYKD